MRLVITVAVVVACSLGVFAQKSNDAVKQQIKWLKAEKAITLTFDGSSTKVMAIGPNFSDADAKAAGVQAMNFGMALFYPGQQLTASPESVNFTFWVLSKKPRFAEPGKWEVLLSTPLDLGEYRYAAKPAENMEYLNFKISREDLAKIAAAPAPVKFRLGRYSLSFTREQLDLLQSYLAVSAIK